MVNWYRTIHEVVLVLSCLFVWFPLQVIGQGKTQTIVVDNTINSGPDYVVEIQKAWIPLLAASKAYDGAAIVSAATTLRRVQLESGIRSLTDYSQQLIAVADQAYRAGRFEFAE